MKRSERYASEVRRETRTAGRVELRQTDSGDWQFEGHPSTWDTYTLEDWAGEYTEEFIPGAFRKTIAERDDIVLLANHEGLPLARFPTTLTLEEDSVGLFSATTLAAVDPDVQAIVPKMQRGDLTQMSIAFRAIRQEWDTSGDVEHRSIIEARLYDVSIVTSPANPFTDAGVRSVDQLLREIAAVDRDEFLAQVRSSHSEGLAVQLRERLESIRAIETERDTGTTIDLDIARRRLELLSL